MRENTERPVTVDVGTDYLIGTDPVEILAAVTENLEERGKKGRIPPLWDGRAGERILEKFLTLA